MKKNERRAARRQFSFQSYGVKICVRAKNKSIVEEIERRVDEILPDGVSAIDEADAEHFFVVEKKKNGEFKIVKNGETVAAGVGGKTSSAPRENEDAFFDAFNSQIRLTVAEYAVGKVFLHAGAVGWKGKAVVMPASSFAGKSTLVAALIKRGALYYSDEYAVLDENGFVSPFPKTLSIRGIVDDYKQVERPAKAFGGVVGTEPIPVGFVLICKFDRRSRSKRKFAPEILSSGQGMLEILAHTIPIRRDPNFALEILYKISSRAVVARCRRGEADDFAGLLLEFLDETL